MAQLSDGAGATNLAAFRALDAALDFQEAISVALTAALQALA